MELLGVHYDFSRLSAISEGFSSIEVDVSNLGDKL